MIHHVAYADHLLNLQNLVNDLLLNINSLKSCQCSLCCPFIAVYNGSWQANFINNWQKSHARSIIYNLHVAQSGSRACINDTKDPNLCVWNTPNVIFLPIRKQRFISLTNYSLTTQAYQFILMMCSDQFLKL